MRRGQLTFTGILLVRYLACLEVKALTAIVSFRNLISVRSSKNNDSHSITGICGRRPKPDRRRTKESGHRPMPDRRRTKESASFPAVIFNHVPQACSLSPRLGS